MVWVGNCFWDLLILPWAHLFLVHIAFCAIIWPSLSCCFLMEKFVYHINYLYTPLSHIVKQWNSSLTTLAVIISPIIPQLDNSHLLSFPCLALPLTPYLCFFHLNSSLFGSLHGWSWSIWQLRMCWIFCFRAMSWSNLPAWFYPSSFSIFESLDTFGE